VSSALSSGFLRHNSRCKRLRLLRPKQQRKRFELLPELRMSACEVLEKALFLQLVRLVLALPNQALLCGVSLHFPME
jgi:hypothetical protein